MKTGFAATTGFCMVLIAACAAQPEQVPGAGGIVIDTWGVNINQYQADLAECKGIAYSTYSDQGRRGLAGAAGGAVVGGALGAIVGDSSRSAAAGAGAGALVGGLSGAGSAGAEANQIIKNCLRGRGYRVLN
ncbi:glycine zipper family protein [Microbulbifer spongiae]|uniref:Glycine zipper family protein n=1 Tax=Microbulbifer spongiae TaxID=2944933 RepID=A0ABY9E8X4_9GAMM|nr:glycine zipper family protein [Microbulbifer sp. MI-G]WKD48592.1 glycine zipper family protein [Microbulbifer sp. MI-G]